MMVSDPVMGGMFSVLASALISLLPVFSLNAWDQVSAAGLQPPDYMSLASSLCQGRAKISTSMKQD